MQTVQESTTLSSAHLTQLFMDSSEKCTACSNESINTVHFFTELHIYLMKIILALNMLLLNSV